MAEDERAELLIAPNNPHRRRPRSAPGHSQRNRRTSRGDDCDEGLCRLPQRRPRRAAVLMTLSAVPGADQRALRAGLSRLCRVGAACRVPTSRSPGHPRPIDECGKRSARRGGVQRSSAPAVDRRRDVSHELVQAGPVVGSHLLASDTPPGPLTHPGHGTGLDAATALRRTNAASSHGSRPSPVTPMKDRSAESKGAREAGRRRATRGK
jgi:hypothetical protein